MHSESSTSKDTTKTPTLGAVASLCPPLYGVHWRDMAEPSSSGSGTLALPAWNQSAAALGKLFEEQCLNIWQESSEPPWLMHFALWAFFIAAPCTLLLFLLSHSYHAHVSPSHLISGLSYISLSLSYFKLFLQQISLVDVQVVLTNQMTTLVVEGVGGQQVPSLGESWAHVPAQRVIVYWSQQQRHAVLYKSPSTDHQTHRLFTVNVRSIL